MLRVLRRKQTKQVSKPTTGVDGGENDLFWRGSNSTCCFDFTTIEQDSVKKKLLKLGDVTNNDVLGFDSRMLF